MSKSKHVFKKPNQTDAEAWQLKGPVKHMMHTTYKPSRKQGEEEAKIELGYSSENFNVLLTFNEQGIKIKEQLYGTDGIKKNENDELGRNIVSHSYDKNDKLIQQSFCSYGQNGKDTVCEIKTPEGTLSFKSVNLHNDDGNPVLFTNYSGSDEAVMQSTVYNYNEHGNRISGIQYGPDGKTINYRTLYEYDERQLCIEEVSENLQSPDSSYNRRIKRLFNEKGDCIEHNFYTLDGRLTKTISQDFKYAPDGTKIYDNYYNRHLNEVISGQTQDLVEDQHGNWTKRTTYYNNKPTQIEERAFVYFDEDAEQTLTHPLSDPNNWPTNNMKPEINSESLSAEDAKWLNEFGNGQPNFFPHHRYYGLRFNDVPSVVSYNGPAIEALNLYREAAENFGAVEIHSYSSIWVDNAKQIVSYTLIFPEYEGYMLHALNLQPANEEDYEIPDNITTDDEGNIYTSQFLLYKPSLNSGKRDDYFESEFPQLIYDCSLKKKPDTPVIYMVETDANGFTMEEHNVDQNFEIKDLEVNYGHGFGKFHSELMHRFNTSTKGLVLFHGLPGTGKTYYIRHLLREMAERKKVVIYMPPNMVDHLVEPSFMTFLVNEVRNWSQQGQFCVLLIEDAEPLLAKRQEGVRIQGITNLLNMTDGLLNDMLNMQIICTFNVDLRKLDSALLRPRRLIARKEFKALSELDANLLASRLGIKHHFTKPTTLGEIYAMIRGNNTLIHDVEPDRNASRNIDDLL